MTTGQRWVVIVAGLAAVLILLFPPWETFGGHYLGHSAITSPPGHTESLPDTHRWALPSPEPVGRVSVSLLAVEYLALGICAAVAFTFLAAPRRKDDA